MLIYRNGRLYAGTCSFALPDGCKINDAPLASYPNGINLKSEDELYMIDVNFEFGQGGAEKSLQDGHLQEDFPEIKFRSQAYPGGTGWSAEYRGDMYSYFEARFDAPTGLVDRDGNEVNIFRIMVTAPRDVPSKTVRRLPIIVSLLNGFLP